MTGAAYPITFPCGDDTLVGIVHPGEVSALLAVVLVVGGPQYRVGSHRQFVQLARYLSERGVPVLRFDTRGMGDSSGVFPGFEGIGDDIRAALDAAALEFSQVRRFALWGLCDAASAILFYAQSDARIAGISLANPWARTESGLSRSRLRHYYVERIMRLDFWRRLATGDVRIRMALISFARTVRNLFAYRSAERSLSPASSALPLPERMGLGFAEYRGWAQIIVSGADLTAREFVDATRRSPIWSRELARPNVVWHNLPNADHTFSRHEWEVRVAELTAAWIETICCWKKNEL